MKRRAARISFFAMLGVLLSALIYSGGCIGRTLGATAGHESEANRAASSAKGQLTSDTVILTINGTPVYWPEFHFWIDYIGKYYKNVHGIKKITDWKVTQNGMLLQDFFLSTAVGYACKDRAIEAKAKEMGVSLSRKDLAKIEKRREKNIEIYGSLSEYRRIVSSMYVSETVYNYLEKMDALGSHMFKHLYGADGEKCSDSQVLEFVRKQGCMCAKYIFLSNTGKDGKPLSAKALAANQNRMTEMLRRLHASDAPLSLFDSLMRRYGEDPEVASDPDGRLFVSGVMGKEFERAYSKLKVNQYSGIVESAKGAYIILRMPIFPDMKTDSSGNTLRYWAAYQLFKKRVGSWAKQMKVVYRDAYKAVDVEGLL